MNVFRPLLFTILFLGCFLSPLSRAQEIVPAKGARLERIEWLDPTMGIRFNNYFQTMIKKPYDNLTFKIKVDQIAKELFSAGYFNAVVKTEFAGTEDKLVVRLTVKLNDKINFEFHGNKIFSYQELRAKLLDKVKNEFNKINLNDLATFISEQYEEVGFYKTTVTAYQNSGKDLENREVKNYFFAIKEGRKIRVQEVLFRGNSILTTEEIEEIFQKNATSLAKGGFYDRAFLGEFSDILKKEYLRRGFVFSEVSRPRLIGSEEDKSVSIEYGIAEKQQVTLRSIDFQKIPPELHDKLKTKLINKEGSPVNVVELEADLRRAISYFQDEGYYFATISNLNSDNLLSYDKSFTYADFRPEVSLDRKICFNEVIINGNIKTKSEVIKREIDIKDKELITPAKLEAIRLRLSGLGLFASLRITPYMTYESESIECPKTNLVVQVKEKDFGLLEIAPGFRTDLGVKLSTGISYNNILGMNRSASLKAQANRRTNLDDFDERRRLEKKSLLEYSTQASFTEPYLLYDLINTQVEMELSSSFQRMRFYGFDADIFRLSPQLSKSFTQWKWLSTSVRYQFERIIQFDATEAKDNDNFSIGGITPSVTLDFRDNPRKGAFFTLSSEWANSNFGSMKKDDLEVNFIKVINRNKFYYPVGDFTLAFSLAMGYQKNFAEEILKDSSGNVIMNDNGKPKTRGYIPSIKVFRLDGFDEIRGYDQAEINRLPDGTPIGEVIVQNEAYFVAFKFEPRYNLTDTLQLGVFFDAGRVFVDHFTPLKLRNSVGLGLKYLTPVGSLDFDYGVKLQRKSPEGKRDSVGRFHLSIGFF